jgi:proline iminopeptidase
MKEPAREGYIKVKGGRIWYSVSGENRPAAPIIVLHGGPAASHYYMEPLRGLAAERPVILYDQLGCGRSDRSKDRSLWTTEHYIEELDDIRKALGLERVHILGQSWGAMVAVDYMLTRHPKGVISLVFSSPSLSVSRWKNDCMRLISAMKEKHRKAIIDSEASCKFDSAAYKLAMFAFYRKHVCRLKIWPACVIKTFMNVGRGIYLYMWGPSEFTVTGTLKDYERAERLKEIKAPMLFTGGRYDESSPETMEYFHHMAPGSELVIFEDASHMHHVEKTKAYLKAVSSFINRAENA